MLPKKIVDNLNKQIREKGLVAAMKETLSSCGTQIKVECEKSGEKEIMKGSVLVVANHPAEADVLSLLSALPKRKDVNLIANASFLNILSEFDKHIIPVYIQHKLINEDRDNIKLRLLQLIHKTPSQTKEEAHKLNIESISKASKKLEEGNLVAMFPGAGNTNGRWFPGVGYVISGCKNCKDLKIVMAYIRGTSNWDYLRVIPGVSKLLPQIRVNFSGIVRIDANNKSAKEVAEELAVQYSEWSKKFEISKKSNKVYFYNYAKTAFLWVISLVRG